MRASMLPVASKCGYAVTLHNEHPEGNEWSSGGTKWHEEMSQQILGKANNTRLAGILGVLPKYKTIESEVKVELKDPENGEVIVNGTADIVLTMDNGDVVVGDWKTGSMARVDPVDENLQLMTYALAIAVARGAKRYRPFLYFTESGYEWGDWVDEKDYWERLDSIKAALTLDPKVPILGSHCDKCYSRKHCKAYMLPAIENPEGALIPITVHRQIDKNSAPALLRLVDAVKKAVEIAESRLKDYARDNGGIKDETGKRVWGPTSVRGRRSVSLETIENAGLLPQLEAAGCIKEGREYESYRWVNVGRKKAS